MASDVKEFNIIVAGVGGQGVLFTSRVLTRAALESGLNFVQSEVHGLAQRYGSIKTEVRIGKDVVSPLIMEGTLDLLLALEPIEALRYAGYVTERTSIVLNTHLVAPVGAYLERLRIPKLEEILDALNGLGPKRLVTLNAVELAAEAGDIVATNSVLLGAADALRVLPFEEGVLRRALEEESPKRYVELNLRAFDLGRDHVLKQ